MIMWKEFKTKNWQRKQIPRKRRETGGKEDREWDGRTAL